MNSSVNMDKNNEDESSYPTSCQARCACPSKIQHYQFHGLSCQSGAIYCNNIVSLPSSIPPPDTHPCFLCPYFVIIINSSSSSSFIACPFSSLCFESECQTLPPGDGDNTEFSCRERGEIKSMKELGKKQGTVSPCAGCKLLRRRCAQDCVFAPYFPADEPQKFANVHKVFGASNVSKLLQEVAVQHRGDVVSSLVYEANARVRDPVYGCVGAISALHRQIHSLQAQLAAAQAQLVHLRMGHAAYLAHIGALAGRGRPSALGTTARSTSSGFSFMSSPKQNQILIAEPPDSATLKSVYGLDVDVVLDQANIGEPSIWSC